MDRNYKSIGLNSHWSDVVNIVSTSRDRTHNWNTICNKLKFKNSNHRFMHKNLHKKKCLYQDSQTISLILRKKNFLILK